MNCLRTRATPRATHAEIAHEVELCECQFVTIVIDIVHDTAISVRRKDLIGSIEYFRLISADSTLSYCFSTSANGILTPQSRERGKGSGAQVRQTAFRIVARASRASVQAVFRAQNETSLLLFGAYLGGSAVLVDANSADAIAVGNAVRRRSDDTIIKRNA
jgi:hypothetical protein